MKKLEAISIIHNALVGYVEDSAGAESEEAKELDVAWNLLRGELANPTGLSLRFVNHVDEETTESYPTQDRGHDNYSTLGVYFENEDGTQKHLIDLDEEAVKEFKRPSSWDVGMIASVIATNLWDEVYEYAPQGSMSAHDLISKWAIEFHNTYEGKVDWGEVDYNTLGFKNSGCWDEAIMEFAKQKLKEIK